MHIAYVVRPFFSYIFLEEPLTLLYTHPGMYALFFFHNIIPFSIQKRKISNNKWKEKIK